MRKDKGCSVKGPFLYKMIVWGDKMKYTRYDLKRKSKNTELVILLIGILLTSVFLGTILSHLFITNSGKVPITDSSKQSNSADNKNQVVNHSPEKFIIIQSGLYSVKKTAEEQNERLKQIINPFMVEEDGKFRVLAGIYTEQDYDEIMKKMTDKKLDNFKITYEVSADEQATYELTEIIKAHLQHLTNLTKPNVSSVKTESFKTWLLTLPNVEKNCKNYSLLEEYKKYINFLPAEEKREKAGENYVFIYNILKKIGTKK